MQFQVARLQEIISKIQFNCKLNFKNAVDVDLMLETQGFDLIELNSLIGAGVKILGFKDLNSYLEVSDVLLPVKKRFIGNFNEQDLEKTLASFDLIEAVVSLEQAEEISHANAYKARVTDILMRVNVLNDRKEYGFMPAELIDQFLAINKLSGIRVRGISSYIPNFSKDERLKKALRKLKVLFVMMQERFRGVEIFSVNLQDNLEDLLAEGVTEVRANSIMLKKE